MNQRNKREFCITCETEIVATVNQSHFREGECGRCESQRYRAHGELVRTIRSCWVAFGERLSTLHDELKEDFADVEDIGDQIGNYEYLVAMCERVLKHAGETP